MERRTVTCRIPCEGLEMLESVKLSQVADWAITALEAIEEQYRDSAVLNVTWDGDTSIDMEAFYHRPETDEDVIQRRAKLDGYALEHRKNEIQQLRYLREKYPDEA